MAEQIHDRIVIYITAFTAQHGYPPTRRDIAAGCHISSTSLVQKYLLQLAARGRIVCHPLIARGISLTA